MAAPPPQDAVPHRTLNISGMLENATVLKVVTLADRRTTPPSPPKEWLFQATLEGLLFPATRTNGTNGTFYRLLGRSQAGNDITLPIRRASIASGTITELEFAGLKALLDAPQARVFTLVPLDAVPLVLAAFGRTFASVALLRALALPRPNDWSGEDSSEEEQDGEGARDGGGAEAEEVEGGAEKEEKEEEEEEEEDEEDEEEEEVFLFSDADTDLRTLPLPVGFSRDDCHAGSCVSVLCLNAL